MPAEVAEIQAPTLCPVSPRLQLIRNETLVAVGLPDVTFDAPYADVDYCLRVFEAGLECVFEPSATGRSGRAAEGPSHEQTPAERAGGGPARLAAPGRHPRPLHPGPRMTSSLPRTLFVGHRQRRRLLVPLRAARDRARTPTGWACVGKPPALRFVAGIAADTVTIEAFAGYDVVVLQQPRGEEWLRVIRDLQARGVTVLFEVDDYMHAVRKIDSHELRDVVDKDWVRDTELACAWSTA